MKFITYHIEEKIYPAGRYFSWMKHSDIEDEDNVMEIFEKLKKEYPYSNFRLIKRTDEIIS